MARARRLSSVLPIALLALGPTLLALASPAAARGWDPRRQKPEWRYVDEEDDAKAAEMLETLLRRHGDERRALRLAKTLRKGRAYPGGLDRSETVERKCADGMDREFTYYLPSRYSPRRPCGVLIFLHGAISQPPPGGGAHEAREIGKAVDDLELIKIGPSTYGRHEWGEPAVREHVHRALRYVKQRFNVDENRVFLAGDSDGGRGTYALAETEATFLAAAVPVIGAPGRVTRFANLRNLPWLAYNGAKDTLFDAERIRPIMAGLKEAGFDLTWNLVADAGHDPFLFLKRKDEVCAFLKEHPRVALPEVVDWQVDPAAKGYEKGFPANTFRWIRIDETGETRSTTRFEDTGRFVRADLPRIRARRSGNRVDVETSRVKRFTVLVSDEVLDLDEPVEVRLNGKVAFRDRVGTDARTVLEEMRRFDDRRLVFSARITIDVDDPPGPAAEDDAGD